MVRRSIVERYSRATVEQRIDIILENYSMFNRILDGYEKSLSIVIRNERDFNRRQQRAFMDYVANHPVFCHWWPLFTVLLGTGTRIGECLGLRWSDLDYENE